MPAFSMYPMIVRVIFRVKKINPFFLKGLIALIGACGRTRTDTLSLTLDFESSASTNSATQALHIRLYHIFFLFPLFLLKKEHIFMFLVFFVF